MGAAVSAPTRDASATYRGTPDDIALCVASSGPAAAALSRVASAYDKAAKVGIIKKEKASRKRSRLQVRLNATGKAPAAAPAKS